MGTASGGGDVERRLRELAAVMFEAGSPEAELAGVDATEAADTIAVMRAALEAVDSWLSSHGQRNEEGFFFEGFPRPEVGDMRDRVRRAKGA